MAIKSFGKTVKYCLFPSLCCGMVFSASAVDIFEMDHDIEARKKAEKQRIKQAYKTASADARKKLADVDKQVGEAKELFDAGKQDKAIEKLQAALAFLNTMEGSMVEHKKKRVRQTMTALRHKWAASLLEKARRECIVERYDRAISLASDASKVDSTKTEEVGKFVEYCQKKIKSKNYTESTSIGRSDKQYYLRERDIHILLQEAKVLYKDKRYAEVRSKLEKVFIKDNFNQEALNLLNKTYNKLYKAGKARAKADQEEQIAFNDWTWIEPALPTEMGRSMSRGAEDRKSIGTDLYEKMQNIIFPKVEFEDVNINSVIRQLNRMSKRYDPDKQGISIVSQLTASVANMTPPITMSFDNMPMSEVIRYLCQGSGLKYRIQDNAVMIGLSSAIDDMKVHLFKVRATMIARIPGVDAGGTGDGGGAGGGNSSIGNNVWRDNNRDGIRQNAEPGLAGVRVQLQRCNGNNVATTTSNATGYYNFAKLQAGSYRIRFVAPSGMKFSPRGRGGNRGKDSDANQSSGITQCIQLGGNDSRPNIDAGLSF